MSVAITSISTQDAHSGRIEDEACLAVSPSGSKATPQDARRCLDEWHSMELRECF